MQIGSIVRFKEFHIYELLINLNKSICSTLDFPSGLLTAYDYELTIVTDIFT